MPLDAGVGPIDELVRIVHQATGDDDAADGAAIMIFGIVGYRQLPISALPKVDFPTIVVTATQQVTNLQ